MRMRGIRLVQRSSYKLPRTELISNTLGSRREGGLTKMFPSRLLDQDFGRCITPQDLLQPHFGFGSYGPNYYRPWKWYTKEDNDWGSTVINEKERFQVTLDVQQFKPNEVSVKVADNQIIIEGKHEERHDDHGYVSRHFKRRYALPKECRAQDVSSNLTSDGILMVKAVKQLDDFKNENEIKVPIQFVSAMSTRKVDAGQENISKEFDKNSSLQTGKERKDKQVMLVEDLQKPSTTEVANKIKAECGSASNKESSREMSQMASNEMSKMTSSEMTKLASSEMSKLASNEISKMECNEKAKMKSDLCNIACKSDAKSASSKLEKEKLIAAASSSKTSEMISESSITTTSSSEMMQSEEISSFITSMTSSVKAGGNTCDIISEIISQELKEAAENI